MATPNPDPADTTPVTRSDGVPGVVDRLFRAQSGRLVAALTRVFGVDRIELAEDVMQDALLKALQIWPFHGIPADPAAWILAVARNLALDILRREQRFRQREDAVALEVQLGATTAQPSPLFTENEIRDDQLRMMFACCHPALTPDTQVALTLKTLCGFGVSEIAAAFLSSEAAVAKKLVRARQRLRDAAISFELPAGPDLDARLDGVLHALYLLFNEGYKASQGECLVRHELCQEAVRLTWLLSQHRVGDHPATHALLALMLFNVARLATRLASTGQPQLLADQDRSRWDRNLIDLAVQHLAKSGHGGHLTSFHFQAGIAACHCTAPTAADTNWPRILQLYDGLLALQPSPIVALHRTVAFARVNGSARALEQLETLAAEPALSNYYLLPAVRAHLLENLGDIPAARRAYTEAKAKATLEPERAFLDQKLAALDTPAPESPDAVRCSPPSKVSI